MYIHIACRLDCNNCHPIPLPLFTKHRSAQSLTYETNTINSFSSYIIRFFCLKNEPFGFATHNKPYVYIICGTSRSQILCTDVSDLPVTGSLAVASRMRVPYIGETHFFCYY